MLLKQEPAVGDMLIGIDKHTYVHEHYASGCHSSGYGVTVLSMGCASSGALLGVCGECTHPEPV